MLKIGVGPSSSHTLGPWRAAQHFLSSPPAQQTIFEITRIEIQLYGSLALTGRGHGTDIAILLGLSGTDPEYIDIGEVQSIPEHIRKHNQLMLAGHQAIDFDIDNDFIFFMEESLPLHANGMRFIAFNQSNEPILEAIYYSVGGGFIVLEDGSSTHKEETRSLTYPIERASDLKRYCTETEQPIWRIVLENESCWRSVDEVKRELIRVWLTMKESIFRGCKAKGTLPGGLNVKRRAHGICTKLMKSDLPERSETWVEHLRSLDLGFSETIKWIGCFAIAVNEENASFGRIVTAPTNGAAGVIPAVLFYYICFSHQSASDEDIVKFLLVAGEIGSIFKKGATISAAMGGCQAEIGVSSAMAAAALTEALGGSPDQAMMAAEIAMEHHLGMTCDPIGGLVQVPCIERNSMGAIKAITAANIALESDPGEAKVSLDDVIKTMWETAQDMNSKYKETSQGGLAVQVPIGLSEC